MENPSPASGPPCLACQVRQLPKPWYRSRKFWCVVLGMSIPPSMWALLSLPIGYVLAMMFPPMAWGFGEWMLDFVKEVTKLLVAWAKAKLTLAVPDESSD